MERSELNTVINRPIDEVFAVLSNLENDLAVDIDSIYDVSPLDSMTYK